MKIIYLLGQPALSGGVKVVFQHANLMHQAGIDVAIAAAGSKPSWATFLGQYINLQQNKLVAGDAMVVATYWTTIQPALKLTSRVVHYCQGYEGAFPHLVQQKIDIEEAYRCNLPTFVVSPHLGDMLSQKYNRTCRLLQPPLDSLFVPASDEIRRHGGSINIFIQGIFECTWKGVGTALEAVNIMRRKGLQCHVTRVSLLPLSDAERAVLEPSNYFCCAEPSVVANQLRASDICLFPSHPEEGFGLPMLEAMGCSIPVVGSDIPSVRHMTQGRLNLVSSHDASAFAEQAMRLLSNLEYRNSAVETGLKISQHFTSERIQIQLIQAIQWGWEQTIEK